MTDLSSALKDGVTVSIVGSYRTLCLPQQFGALFRDGILADPRNGTPMEMDGYSAYLALKAIARRTGADFSEQGKRLAEAAVSRLRAGFAHRAWTGLDQEVHMRFTAAACRLLIDAFADNLIEDKAAVLDALKVHLSFAEPLARGVWFLHDSMEQASFCAPHPQKPLRSNAFGSSDRNCLVLNTHLDTLSTLLYALRVLPLGAEEQAWLGSSVNVGIEALSLVLAPRHGRMFSALDHGARELALRFYRDESDRSRSARLYRRVYWRIAKPLFRLRRRMTIANPSFRFSDGYIERDIRLVGLGFFYHVCNVWDLCRFLVQLRESHVAAPSSLVEVIEAMIDRGLNYALNSSYWHYLLAAARDTGHPLVLCETILIYLGLRGETFQPPERMVKAYCALRRTLPPTAAILGHDPFVVADTPMYTPITATKDNIVLRSGRGLSIDIDNEQISFH